MRIHIKPLLNFLVLLALVASQAASWSALAQAGASPSRVESFTGRWRVKFRFEGDAEKHLTFEAKTGNVGSFLLLDTGPDDKPVLALAPAVWSQLTNDRFSFSGDAELPLGTCCREIGTLIFKGKLAANNSISGRVIFVTSIDEEESPLKYRSRIGTFTASRAN
jgi:hypothetical protein